MSLKDKLYVVGLILTLVFVLVAIYPFTTIFADNYTRRDWGNGEWMFICYEKFLDNGTKVKKVPKGMNFTISRCLEGA